MQGLSAETSPDRANGTAGLRALFSAGSFGWLFLSNVAFFLGMQSQGLVRGYLAYQLTGSEFALGGVSFAVAVPMLILSPFGGALADRVDRRLMIMVAQSLVLVSESSILLLYVFGELQFWHLLCSSLAMGCVFPLMSPARVAIVAQTVGRGLLPRAVAVNMTGMNSTRVIGPALGGMLVFDGDVRFAYMVGLLFYSLAFGAMLAVPPTPPPADVRQRSFLANLSEGFRYVLDQRLIALLLTFGLMPMFLAMPFQQLLPAFTERVWEVGSRGLALLGAATGLGGVCGSLFVAWRGDFEHRIRVQLLSMIGFGGGIALFCWAPWFPLALPLALLATLCASIFGTINSTAIQVLIPDAVRGRVSSFLMMSFSLPLLGVLPVSYVARELGPRIAVSAAGLLALTVAGAFVMLSPTLRGLDRAVRDASIEE